MNIMMAMHTLWFYACVALHRQLFLLLLTSEVYYALLVLSEILKTMLEHVSQNYFPQATQALI